MSQETAHLNNTHAKLGLPQRYLPNIGLVVDNVTLPSGLVVSIRETNGEDDEILSNYARLTDGSAGNEYTARIIHSGPNGKKMTIEEVESLKIRDRQFIMFVSRIISLGEIFEFRLECPSPKCTKLREQGLTKDIPWEEDLIKYFVDMGNKDNPVNKLAKSSSVITPYINGNTKLVEISLDEHKFRFKAYTGKSEVRESQEDQSTYENKLNLNTILYMREMEYLKDGNWVTPSTFQAFPSRIMARLRNEVLKLDDLWKPITTVKCPTCGTVHQQVLLQIKDFLFPEEI